MTTTTYVREHLAHLDTGNLAETLVPAAFRDIDYSELNGIEGPLDANEAAEWDYGRYGPDA